MGSGRAGYEIAVCGSCSSRLRCALISHRCSGSDVAGSGRLTWAPRNLVRSTADGFSGGSEWRIAPDPLFSEVRDGSPRPRSGMSEASASLYHRALKGLDMVLSGLDDEAVDRIVHTIAQARHVAVYGACREGLQIRGFAMRPFHLGRSVSVVGDVTAAAWRHRPVLGHHRPGRTPNRQRLPALPRASGPGSSS